MTITMTGRNDTPTAHHKNFTGAIAFDDTLPLDETGDTTSVMDGKGMKTGTFFFQNTSDKTVEFTIQGSYSRDAEEDEWHSVTTTVSLTDGSVTKQIDKYHLVENEYYPYYRVQVATASGQGAATEGSAEVIFTLTRG